MNVCVCVCACVCECARARVCVTTPSALPQVGECVNVVHRNLTPLHMAARCGYDQLVDILVDAHANCNAGSANLGLTPLICATCAGM